MYLFFIICDLIVLFLLFLFILFVNLLLYYNLYLLTETCSSFCTRTVRRNTLMSTTIVYLVFSQFGASFIVGIASVCEFYLIYIYFIYVISIFILSSHWKWSNRDRNVCSCSLTVYFTIVKLYFTFFLISWHCLFYFLTV